MKSLTIGRNPKNDIVIDHPTVSSQHAVLMVYDMKTITIRDLGSTNGTFVNKKRISSVVQLNIGDSVNLGQASFDWQKYLVSPGKTIVSPHPQVFIPQDIKEKKTIGRNNSSDIVFNQTDVSDRHAFLCQKIDGTILIIDNNSTNGTYVNGERISAKVLVKGDVVLIAQKYRLNWEAYFKSDNKKKPKSSGISFVMVASILLIIGVGSFFCWYFASEHKKTPTEIYSYYKKSVVLVVQSYTYDVTCQGRAISDYFPGVSQAQDLDHCYINEESQELESGNASVSGTGFYISNDGKLMTNRHVIDTYNSKHAELIKNIIGTQLCQMAMGTKEKQVQNMLYGLANNLEVKYRVVYLGVASNDTHITSMEDFKPCIIVKKSTNPSLDVAVLQLNNKKTPNEVEHIVNIHNYAADASLELGKSIHTLGFPMSFIIGSTSIGLEANNQSGTITQERGEYIYGHNISIYSGASGSPVFDEYGKFAGIIVSGFLGVTQGYNHAIQPKPVSDFYK